MPRYVGRDHDEQEGNDERKDRKEVRIQADESERCKERQRMCRSLPSEESYHSVLENEHDANASIEVAEVVGHQRKGESWSADILGRAAVDNVFGRFGEVFGGYYLLEESEEVSRVLTLVI